MKTLESRTKFDSSPARALQLAAQQFISSGRVNSSKLVFLFHDGVSVDLVVETLEARNNLERIGVKVFAITSTAKPNLSSLLGYVTNRQFIYDEESGRNAFYEEIKKAAVQCPYVSELSDESGSVVDGDSLKAAITVGMRRHKAKEAKLEEKLNLKRICKSNKVDLMIVLDSSGSVFGEFENGLKFVHNLINSLTPTALEDGRIQVSLVRFASSAEVVIPFEISQTRNEILKKLDKIKFTGGSTRIANGVHYALADLARWRRDDAIQIFILISDGNGQELWHMAQIASRKLQSANVEVFAVPISLDYNLDELTLYTGDANRVYLQEEQNQFVTTISSLINKCAQANLLMSAHEQPYATSFSKQKLNVFEIDSTAVVKSKAGLLRRYEKEVSKEPVLKIGPSSRDSNLTTFSNSLDELNSTEMTSAHEQSMVEAKDGTPLITSSKQDATKLEGIPNGDLIKKLIMESSIKEEQVAPNIAPKAAKIFPQIPHLDLLFAIDLSADSPISLKAQLKLLAELVNKVTDNDIEEERIRIAIVTFAKDVRLHLEWGNATTKAQILQRLSSVAYAASDSSVVAGITFATQYARKFRRLDARLIIILVSNGNSQDLRQFVTQAAKKLNELKETVVYALTTSKQYTFDVLEAFTNDRWKIYVDGRTRRFVFDASKELLKKEVNENVEPTNVMSSPLIELIQMRNGLVDLFILMDKSTLADDDFEAAKRFLEELVHSLQIIDPESRIRISLITFAADAHTEIDLRKPATKEDVLYAVERLQNEYSKASVSKAVNAALLQVSVPREDSRQRIFVILTDGSTEDSTQTINVTAAKLKQTDAEVFLVPLTDDYSVEELLLYGGGQGTLITSVKDYRKKMDGGSSAKNDFVKVEKIDQTFAKRATPSLSEQPHVMVKPNLKSATKSEVSPHFDDPSTAINIKAQQEDPNCLVDLMFIIDTSQSVETNFQKQLQFTAELIKRIPSSAFHRRIRVASISFSSQPQLNFHFHEFNNQAQILDVLLSLQHSGGNTSSVNAVNFAIREIQERGRGGVRRMIVLITDGHSQDRWEDVLDAADRLHAIATIVYALAANDNYYFRQKFSGIFRVAPPGNIVQMELELYAGSKWLVYADARERQFLDDASDFLLRCRSPIPALSPEVEAFAKAEKVDEGKELKRRKFSAASISALPCKDDDVDLLFIIDTSASTETYFNSQMAYAMDLIEVIPLEEFSDRLAVALVQFSDVGKLHFGFKTKQTQEDIKYQLSRLEHTAGETSSLAAGVKVALLEISSNRRPSARLVIVVFANGNSQDIRQISQNIAKLRETGGEIYVMTPFSIDELAENAGNVAHVYAGDRENNFTQDIINAISKCEKHGLVERVDGGSVIERVVPDEIKQRKSGNEKEEKQHSVGTDGLITSSVNDIDNNAVTVAVAVSEKLTDQTRIAKSLEPKRCAYSKMDLEIILDASSSRQEVFEHQRELALSLIERLPIDDDETHVAMVRRAIEDIKYHGGSTFTARAIELSVQDLERGRRPDAIQVVVLMNDGKSQDPWEEVIEASKLLRATGAELFGVALGGKIDLRELKHYIGDTDRIYGDNSTERFLTDVISLLTDGQNCRTPFAASLPTTKASASDFNNQSCNTANLHIIILFDNAIKGNNVNEQWISLNRYLLLDVLGSLPPTKHSGRVIITVITFSTRPQLIVSMHDLKDRDSIFTQVESIRPQISKSSYAKAINFAVQEYNEGYREDVRGMLVIVGDGRSDESIDERHSAVELLRTAKNLSTYAVDSGKLVDVETLSEYTGSADNIFNYHRNAEFAKIILEAVEAAIKTSCIQVIIKNKATTTAVSTRIPRPTTTSASKKQLTRGQSTSKVEKKDETVVVVDGKNLKEKHLEGISKSSRLLTTRVIPKFSSHRQRENITAEPHTTTTTTTTIFTTLSTTSSRPGCELDAIMLIDSSGSMEKMFNREKEFAAEIINRLRIGPRNAHIAIIKFASKDKVKTVWSFDKPQEKEQVLEALKEIPFSSGTTAIHVALLQAIAEYSAAKGARPQRATPFVIVFTDGFAQKDTMEAATLLRNKIPNVFAVAVSNEQPVNEEELIKIAGTKDRVFMDNDSGKLFGVLEKITRIC
ncbi:unnamed protein product [Litomosoides sigmodontis]|uniref:VWFA domain-containing protein n=1 Tax=Litomosoides sigmodontis TaxID=42156 RepID=A0A3P6TCP9_LITSI|nr:unnamed protein product [Litomosoides sigmodontis]